MSAEEWIEKLNAIIKQYRENAVGPHTEKEARAEALAECRKLGLTDGEAAKYLKAKGS